MLPVLVSGPEKGNRMPFGRSLAWRTGMAAAVLVSLALVVPMTARAQDEYTSIFTDGGLKGAGWGRCVTAIVWDADVSDLSPRAAKNSVADLDWAISTWAAAAGVQVSRGAEAKLVYDNSSATVAAPGAGPGKRKLYVKFVKDSDSNYLSGRVVGVATPTSVIPDAPEIIGGSAAFRVDYVEYASKSESRTLLLHELGHALGLGHSNNKKSVMFPIVTKTVKLAPSDVAGIKAFTKNCDPAFDAMRSQ